MRWEDERYVRIYTRDTPDWLAMEWQGRAVFYELSRKVDRSGFVPLGKSGTRGLAGLLHMPVEVVEVGIEELLTDGCVVRVDGGLLIRNFLDAQETRQSDVARKRAQRERDRDQKRATAVEAGHGVTPGDTSGHSVTNRDQESQNVTDGHDRSHEVTDGHDRSLRAVPCCAVPNLEDPPTPRGAGEAGRSLPLVLEPLSAAPAPKKRREGLSPSEQAYSDAYVAGQEAAEPGCGFRPLTSAACRLVGAAAQTHAKDRFRQRLTGDALLAWIRETSAEFRRAAEPQYAQGYSAHAFGAWLDAGRPMTRREPLPEPSRIIIPERAPPPPKNRRMTADEQARFHAEILSLKPQEDADGNRHADHEA